MKTKATFSLLLSLLVFFTGLLHSQERVKIATYNILNYPNQSSSKNPRFQTIMNDMNPDILVVQEILSQSAVNQFRDAVLGDDYQAGDFINGPDTDNAIFYKDSLFQFISTGFIAPNAPRYISVFRLYHKITLDTLIIYSAHFKASSGVSNENIRFIEATTLRIFTDMLPSGSNFILVGDLNLYRSTEPAFEELLVQDGTGYFLDPINRPGNWHDGLGFADIHTQSTRIPDLGDGGSTNGLDDRFDFILISQAVLDQTGIDYVNESYHAFGNDGLHFNLSVHDPPNQVVSTEVAIALYLASDHLPVVAEFDFGVVSGVEDQVDQPGGFVLKQNYPNPFNPLTTIRFTTDELRFTILKVYDLLGTEVATLVNEEKPAGTYEVQFDGSELPSGVYFYQLRTGDPSTGSGQSFVETRNMILLK